MAITLKKFLNLPSKKMVLAMFSLGIIFLIRLWAGSLSDANFWRTRYLKCDSERDSTVIKVTQKANEEIRAMLQSNIEKLEASNSRQDSTVKAQNQIILNNNTTIEKINKLIKK